MYKVLILEDIPIQSAYLANIVRKMGHEIVGIATSVEEALKIFYDKKPDIVLLDIKVKGDMDGIECGKIIKKECIEVVIIYLTAYSLSFEEAAASAPEAFITKPYNDITVEHAIRLAISKKPSIQTHWDPIRLPNIYFSLDCIWVKVGAGEPFIKILIDEILYAEKRNMDLEIHTTKRKKPYILTLSISDFMKYANYCQIVRIHRSYVVNVKHVKAFIPTKLTLTNDVEIPVSEQYWTSVRDALLRGGECLQPAS